MKFADIAIIGGGLAGSTAAAMLGRAGISAAVIDPHETYPFDFRVEKLSGDAPLDRFFRTGIAESVLRAATHDDWIALLASPALGPFPGLARSGQFAADAKPVRRYAETPYPPRGRDFNVAIGLTAITKPR